jgi:hypothetical protein
MQELFSGGRAQDMLQWFYAIQGVLSSIEREGGREGGRERERASNLMVSSVQFWGTVENNGSWKGKNCR